MKKIILFTAFVLSTTAQAAQLNYTCDVVNVLDGFFEESLGETGDAMSDDDAEQVRVDVSDRDGGNVDIGQNSFTDGRNETLISVRKNAAVDIIDVSVAGAQALQLRISRRTQTGIVLHKVNGAETFSPLADIDCNDYTAVKEAILRGRVDSKEIAERRLPKDIAAKMGRVDVPFEMGDGYYDLQDEKYYELSLNGKVVGYTLESYMSYTEGDDVIAETHFLANGVRFAGPTE